MEQFNHLELEEFACLIKEVVYQNFDLQILSEQTAAASEIQSNTFAKRLVTGQAAEQYFRANFSSISEFQGFEIEDTTQMGCGFDFKLTSARPYCGVEVKGLSEPSGSVMLTDKEHAVAEHLQDRYFLFVVKNFREKPAHAIYQNPLCGELVFSRVENTVVQVNWKGRV